MASLHLNRTQWSNRCKAKLEEAFSFLTRIFVEILERLRKPMLYPTELRGHLIFHSLGVGLFASVSIDKLPEPFPQLITHQRVTVCVSDTQVGTTTGGPVRSVLTFASSK